MKYALFSGGKRIRPLLGLQVAKALAAAPAECLPSLAAVELLHTASLIIDDLPCMDNTAIRRAQPATHVRYGEGIAILTGFALLVLSVRVSQDETGRFAGLETGTFLDMLLDAVSRRGLISGQEVDITAQSVSDAIYAKTVPLFELACAAGLTCCEVPVAIRSGILAFGRRYGRAFQAVDDMLDLGRMADQTNREIADCSVLLDDLQAQDSRVKPLRTFIDWLRECQPAMRSA